MPCELCEVCKEKRGCDSLKKVNNLIRSRIPIPDVLQDYYRYSHCPSIREVMIDFITKKFKNVKSATFGEDTVNLK